MVYRALLKLKPKSPFDFALSTAIFGGGDKEIRSAESGLFRQAIRAAGSLVQISVTSTGTIDKPSVQVEISSPIKISPDIENAVAETITDMFNMNLDLQPFYETVRNDRVLSKFTSGLRGLRSPSTPTIFEALSDSIIEQQISLIAAHAISKRMVKAFGESLVIDGEKFYEYPGPSRLAEAGIEDLKKCGLSNMKIKYIQNISRLVLEGKLDLDKMKKYRDSKRILRELDDLPGIGDWTAELTMIRGMQKFDALPADDIGIRRSISHFYFKDRRISAEEARSLAEKWGEWRGLAAFYLIVAEIKGLKP
jgi:DNA-3-methyladenine glycosylase II